MKILLLGLAALAIGLATRRFYLTEHIGYDVNALFLLLVGIQLLVAAMLFGERNENHNRSSASSSDHDRKDK
ncbi:MAG: hypothetical protein NNA18_04125 [Nitrospira sp.]|nr:hypothetical protein [Nitrospira sp.]